MQRALADRYGMYVVQLGMPYPQDLLADTRFRLHIGITAEQRDTQPRLLQIRADTAAIPLANDSADTLVLPHTLDMHLDPHRVLREAERVLVPEGYILILGFQPYALWRLARALGADWPVQPIGLHRLKDWLSLLNLDVAGQQTLWLRMAWRGLGQRYSAWERFAQRWLHGLGSVYLLTAQKRVPAMTPLRVQWHKPRRRLTATGLEPAQRTGTDGH